MTQNMKVLQAVDHLIYQYFDFDYLGIIQIPRGSAVKNKNRKLRV